ncbi:virion structural protein [Synechococcus phage S-CBS4]|uniref:virion structural protein n=1 Tax=Synechococcus phage S-CBS4 TaxID=756275 RepID=UPI000246A713|nr:virion structural protein [Synechococcus phage S-CBS4]AEX56026.1 hypothetical protein S-CBS4_gp059 [Synechococcus phage S-CBS4]AGN30496.1 hypothetical protein SXAG_00049 [Synechococcus phage S-CBS4]
MSWTITGQEAGSLGLLDQYGGAASAYSLRNLSLYHTDPVVRVRRDNDNAEQDFTAAEVSDGTLAAWVGAGNDGFVRTWYDQSGNGNNAQQAIAARQPKIVDNGALVAEGGKTAIDFDGSDDGLDTATTVANAGDTTVFVISKADESEDAFRFVAGQWLGGSTRKWNLIYSSSFFTQDSLYFGTNDGTNNNTPSITGNNDSLVQKLSTGIAKSTSTELFVNQVSAGVQSCSALESTATKLFIGYQFNPPSAYGSFMDGKIQEVIVYSSDQSANRIAIEANINAHYNIF